MDEHRPDPADEIRPDETADRNVDSETSDSPLGGDKTTENQLEADNEVEQDSLKSLDPDDNPA